MGFERCVHNTDPVSLASIHPHDRTVPLVDPREDPKPNAVIPVIYGLLMMGCTV